MSFFNKTVTKLVTILTKCFVFSYLNPTSYLKKESLAQVFSCEFCENSKNTFFIEHHRVTTSEILRFSRSRPEVYCKKGILKTFPTSVPESQKRDSGTGVFL